jgi:uncharacterized protein
MSAEHLSGLALQRRRSLAVLPLLVLGSVLPRVAAAGSYDDFFRAVKIDNGRAIRSLLARGFDPNTIEPVRGDAGLILALREESMTVFRILLEARGTDINARAFNGDTALMIASFKGNQPAVEALLASGAQVDHSGWTPLHYAAASGHNVIVRLLLDRAATLDARSPNNTTPIMMAAWGGHIMTVKLLLDEGADATLTNDHGMTAIDFAARSEHTDIVEGLTWRLKRAGKL